MPKNSEYPAKFDVTYPKTSNRLTTLFRLVLVVPTFIVLSLVTGGGFEEFNTEATKDASMNGGGIVAGLLFATALMILFQQKYPRWWFDFNLELNRYSARVGAYVLLLTDRYPSTDEKQDVTFDVYYPDVQKDLNRWLPLVKWLLALPHYIALAVLAIGALIVTLIAWVTILITGRYPRSLFDFVVGVGRWSARVTAYAFLLTTDKYPPFTLK